MATVVVLNNNIYDEDCVKRVRGESFEASKKFIDSVLEGDESAGRPQRITEVTAKRGRKASADEAE